MSGGADTGLQFIVQTATCRDCRVIFDSVVRVRMPDTGLKLLADFQRARLRKTEEKLLLGEVKISMISLSNGALY